MKKIFDQNSNNSEHPAECERSRDALDHKPGSISRPRPAERFACGGDEYAVAFFVLTKYPPARLYRAKPAREINATRP